MRVLWMQRALERDLAEPQIPPESSKRHGAGNLTVPMKPGVLAHMVVVKHAHLRTLRGRFGSSMIGGSITWLRRGF